MQKSKEFWRQDLNFIPHLSLYWTFMKQLHASFFRQKYRKQHDRNINSENCVCSDRFPYFLRIDTFSVILQFPKCFTGVLSFISVITVLFHTETGLKEFDTFWKKKILVDGLHY